MHQDQFLRQFSANINQNSTHRENTVERMEEVQNAERKHDASMYRDTIALFIEFRCCWKTKQKIKKRQKKRNDYLNQRRKPSPPLFGISLFCNKRKEKKKVKKKFVICPARELLHLSLVHRSLIHFFVTQTFWDEICKRKTKKTRLMRYSKTQ